MKPDKCKSKEDGVCRLPIGTCAQCEQEIVYTETEVYHLINKALVFYTDINPIDTPLCDWFEQNKKQ